MDAVKAPPPFTTKDSKQCPCQEVLSIFDEGEGNLAKIDKNSREVFADAQKRQRFTDIHICPPNKHANASHGYEFAFPRV